MKINYKPMFLNFLCLARLVLYSFCHPVNAFWPDQVVSCRFLREGDRNVRNIHVSLSMSQLVLIFTSDKGITLEKFFKEKGLTSSSLLQPKLIILTAFR